MTIIPGVIALVAASFFWLLGQKKGKVLAETLKSVEDFLSLPMHLVSGVTWLLDGKAGDQLRDYLMALDMREKEDN